MADPLQLSLPESFWAAEGRRLAVLIVPRLAAMALEGARRGSDKIGVGFVYGIYNLLAEQWAREYTDALLKQVRTTNEAVVGDILAGWISTPGSTFGDLHAALQPFFGIKRASVIAVTEATRAMAAGELLTYQRAGIEKIQWGTNKDELVCPYCGGVNREVRTIGEPFGYFKWRKGQAPEPVYAPPYHPNCRCGISPVLASVSVRKTVLILSDAAIVARTLRTLPPILAKGDFDGHPFRGNQWTETEKGIDSRGALWRRYPVRDANGNATKNYAYTVDGGEDIPEPLVEAINKNTSEGWRLVRFNYNAKSKTWHIADAGEDDVPTHAMFANESMEANGTEADDLVRGFYDVEQNAISIYDFTGFDNDNLVRNKATEKYLRSAERNLFTYNGEKPKLLYLTLDDMQMAAGPGDLAKGDFDGHPFRGNQWTGSQAPIPYLGDANDDRRIPTVADSPIQHIVQEQLKTLPENHMDGIRDITFAEGNFVGGDAYGDYHPLTKRIRLASNADNISVLGGGTAIHEVGHHVHISRMTDEGAEEWQRISGNGQNARISAYARTNRGEHFAEAYRAYMRGGDYRKKLKILEPASYKYMASVSRGKWLLPEGESASTDAWRSRYED